MTASGVTSRKEPIIGIIGQLGPAIVVSAVGIGAACLWSVRTTLPYLPSDRVEVLTVAILFPIVVSIILLLTTSSLGPYDGKRVWASTLTTAGMALALGTIANMLLLPFVGMFHSEYDFSARVEFLADYIIVFTVTFALGLIPRSLLINRTKRGTRMPSMALLAGLAGVAVTTMAVLVRAEPGLTYIVIPLLVGTVLASSFVIAVSEERWQDTLALLQEQNSTLRDILAEQDAFLSQIRDVIHSGPLQVMASLSLMASSDPNGMLEARRVEGSSRDAEQSLRGLLVMTGASSGELADAVADLAAVIQKHLGLIDINVDGDSWSHLSSESKRTISEITHEVLVHHAAWDGAHGCKVSFSADDKQARTLIEIASRSVSPKPLRLSMASKARLKQLKGYYQQDRNGSLVLFEIRVPCV